MVKDFARSSKCSGVLSRNFIEKRENSRVHGNIFVFGRQLFLPICVSVSITGDRHMFIHRYAGSVQ